MKSKQELLAKFTPSLWRLCCMQLVDIVLQKSSSRATVRVVTRWLCRSQQLEPGPGQLGCHTPSLYGTFLQTLPDLVTPLKGHSLFPRSCPTTRSAPSERFGYCRSNLAPKHARKHETHPPRVKRKKFRLDSNDFGFI